MSKYEPYIWLLVLIIGLLFLARALWPKPLEFTITDCTFEDMDPNAAIGFICPICQRTRLLFSPDPVTLKREIGATVEVTGKWSCNNCSYPLDVNEQKKFSPF